MTSETPNKPSRVKSPREVLRALLMLDDTDHSIALGSAIGIGIGLTPTVGIQMFVVLVVAFFTRKMFHFNRLAAIAGVYISNPLTMIPMYWFLYKIGGCFVEADVTREQFAAIFEYQGFAEWWQTICDLFVGIGWPMMIGTAIVAPIGGVLTYPLMRWLLRWLKPRKPTEPSSSTDLPQPVLSRTPSESES
jgi:uncharacterized protein (DUF2062 family)